MDQHKKLQRRVFIGVAIFVVLVAAIAIPLAINDQLRYDVALQTNSIPGKDAEKIADSDDGALLIVLPLDNPGNAISPWLYLAQFIAWPDDNGYELQNLESDVRAEIPLESIEFTSASGDGSLVLMRGIHAESGEESAITIAPTTMDVRELPTADSVPDQPGEWDVSIWEKVEGICNRPSPHQQYVACFNRADFASYFAGDWQLELQVWGNYVITEPIFRGMGFLPMVGFVHNDTVLYWQNEIGIWRMEVPGSIQNQAPPPSPRTTPVATPES